MLDDDEDDAVECYDGVGRVELDTGALTEAIFRWRRGERKEALHWIENAFEGREFQGLGELTPEQLR